MPSRSSTHNFSLVKRWMIYFCLIKSVKLRIVVQINHLQQDVEQVDGHVHAEVDGVRWQKEVEGLQVRIWNRSFNLLLIWKLTLEMIEAIYSQRWWQKLAISLHWQVITINYEFNLVGLGFSLVLDLIKCNQNQYLVAHHIADLITSKL
jgi:hypothetical protein